MRSFYIYFFFFLTVVNQAKAQMEPFLRVDPAPEPTQLVERVLLSKKSDIEIRNVQYKGAVDAIGSFQFKTLYNTLVPKGIIISTGNAADAVGPNNESGKSQRFFGAADMDLQRMSDDKIVDAAVLEFDLKPSMDSLCFRYFFASEEYPEFVNKGVNDVFAFFLTDLETNHRQNLALLQPNNVPIAVDNINANKNTQYFVPNESWDVASVERWRGEMQKGELAYALQYDGMTTILQASTRVQAEKWYHLKLAIADAGDGLFDSAIFLEGESLRSLPHALPPRPPQILRMERIVRQEFDSTAITVRDSAVALSLKVNFASNSYLLGELASLELLQKIADILKADPTMELKVEGHTDNAGTPAFNQKLSVNRARTVADYLVTLGIARDRLSTVGYGSTQPLGNKNLAANRRVVFVFTSK